jgi:hypothetical protein
VDPRWILSALAAVFAIALACAYGSLCLLFYQGQWQLVLHPSRTVASTPASQHLPFTELHLFDDASGHPQLDAWWIPAANPAAPTVLMLHSGDGSMAGALPRALTLHNAQLNVLLFDYRGYGRSTGRHPDESSMQADSAAALRFLLSGRHLPPSSIVLYGAGVGGSLAVRLAALHPELHALILDAPDGDFAERVSRDPRARLVPTHWLFSQTFPLAAPLHTLPTPKLLLSYGATPPVLQRAAPPKTILSLTGPDDPALPSAIQHFIQLALPAQPQTP